MNNIMLDLETLGYDVIVQIGACYFDEDGNIGDKFLANIVLYDSLNIGKVDSGQLKWWLERADKITWIKEAKHLHKTLEELSKFIDKKARVWSHYYDILVLENVCRKLKRKLPFKYKMWRDIRTLVYLSGIKREKKILSKCCGAEAIVQGGVTKYYLCSNCKKPCDVTSDPKTHNALDDCIHQVKYVVEAMRRIKNDKVIGVDAPVNMIKEKLWRETEIISFLQAITGEEFRIERSEGGERHWNLVSNSYKVEFIDAGNGWYIPVRGSLKVR